MIVPQSELLRTGPVQSVLSKKSLVRMPAHHYNKIYSGKCDLNALIMPENAHSWSCNKPIYQDKVEKYTKCKIVCLEGFDLSKSKYLNPRFLSIMKRESAR